MSKSPRQTRWAAVALFAAAAAVGTFNTAARRSLDIQARPTAEGIIITGLPPDSEGLAVGDRLLRIAGREAATTADVRWLTQGFFSREPVTVVVQRAGGERSYEVIPQPIHPLFVLLNALLGLTFLTVGLMVVWGGARDPTSRSFFRLNSLTGIAILLFSHENRLSPAALHHLYAYTWLVTYTLIPAALVEFLAHFQREQPRRLGVMRSLALYIPPLLMFFILAILYAAAWQYGNPWRQHYEAWFNRGFTALLLAYFAGGMVILLAAFLKPVNPAMRDRVRWLGWCTVAGLIPFFLFYKAPALAGSASLLPLPAVLAAMLIVPLGWGMSVASFRMFKLEWVLSRTIIYAVSLVAVICLLIIGVMLGLESFHRRDATGMILLTIAGALVGSLAILGLAELMRRFMDRFYYRDWYDYRRALAALEVELATAVTERGIVEILTTRLAELLKIERATLVVRRGENLWVQPDQTWRLQGTPEEPVGGADRRGLTLPLNHLGAAIGMLQLGGKLSGAPYSLRDRALLETLSAHAATALANLELTRHVMDGEKRALAADMAGGIAHEINNALSPMLGRAQLLERALQPEGESGGGKAAESLGIIVDMCRRIKRISDDLGHISEPPRPDYEILSLNDVARGTVRLLGETAGRIKRFTSENSGALYQLALELEPELPSFRADRSQLGQVYINLILNAADAVEEVGGGTLTIGSRSLPDSAEIAGFVADTGAGIAPEIRDKIFQPYFTTKPPGKGTGLGLAVVRSIVEAHGGRLAILPVEPTGTRVEFILPLNRP